MGRGPEQTFFHRGHQGLPGALVGKALPTKARHMGSTPGPHVMRQVWPCITTIKPAL